MESPKDHESDGSITPRQTPQTPVNRPRRGAINSSVDRHRPARPDLAAPAETELDWQRHLQLAKGNEQLAKLVAERHAFRARLVKAVEATTAARQRRGKIRDDNEQEEDMASNAFPPLDTSMSGGNRAGASPTTMQPGGSVNGNGVGAAGNLMAPLPVGHQQDLNYLYSQIQELGGILRSNRDKVNVITRAAEEVAKRANGTLADGEGGSEADKARIRELERELAKANHIIEIYKHEQKENTNLIAMYEDALGTATEQIRNYATGIEARFLAQRKHYNNLLQQEKDEHLQSRLDRDQWNALYLEVCRMIRTAHHLRNSEWTEEYTIIAGLQAQVRCLRRCMGMEAEEPEEEIGWPYLKELPLNDQA